MRWSNLASKDCPGGRRRPTCCGRSTLPGSLAGGAIKAAPEKKRGARDPALLKEPIIQSRTHCARPRADEIATQVTTEIGAKNLSGTVGREMALLHDVQKKSRDGGGSSD